MAEKTSGSIKDNVIGGVLTAGILAIGGAIWAFAPGAWGWFTGLLSSIWVHLTGDATVPTWWLYALSAVSAAAVLRVSWKVWKSIRSDEPTILDYKQDYFYGALWRWQYGGGYQPIRAWAFCPHCDTQLVYSDRDGFKQFGITLHCETCHTQVMDDEGDRNYLVAKIHRQVERKIRTGEWKKHVEPRREAKADSPA